MSNIINNEKLSENLTLTECKDGFWLWDNVVEMNLAMRAKTREAALLECIEYYQRRLPKVLRDLMSLQDKVDSFLVQFKEEDNDPEW